MRYHMTAPSSTLATTATIAATIALTVTNNFFVALPFIAQSISVAVREHGMTRRAVIEADAKSQQVLIEEHEKTRRVEIECRERTRQYEIVWAGRLACEQAKLAAPKQKRISGDNPKAIDRTVESDSLM